MISNSKVICILGSGRCGTSAVTRSLNMLGVDIGSNFISKNDTNPKGFWEDKQIVGIHKKLIKEFKEPEKSLSPDLIKSERFKQYKDMIIEYLESNLVHNEIWAWKDPRSCYTLELWKEVFKELEVLPHYLIMVRNPIDVVHSYKQSYHTRKERALYQWKLRTLLALSKTYGECRILIDYNHLISDSVGTMKRIANEFNLPWPKNEDQLISDLNSFIDPNLQHSRSDMEKLVKSNNYNSDIKNLYHLFYKASLSSDFLNSDEFNTKVNEYLNNIS